ncbi:MAG: cation-translocating P-type ATPase [Brevinematales bacterium]|nr:cation-translocating P-type ATPase [Brevinematales bacterium]
MNEMNFKVVGMSCPSCATTVEKIVSSFDGVYRVKVNFSSSTLYFISKPSFDISTIRNKLKQFGYDIVPTTDSVDLKKEKINLLIVLILSIPLFIVMFLKMLGLGYHSDLLKLVMFLLSSIIVLVGGFKVHRSGVLSLIYLSPNSDSLVSVGSLSALSTFFLSKFLPIDDFSIEAVIVMDVFLIGNYVKLVLSQKSIGFVSDLYKLFVDSANVLENGVEIKKSIRDIKIGDIVVVRAGERVPMDGRVIEGSSSVEETFMTGESLPRVVKVGDNVFAGSYNIDGFIKVLIDSEVKDSVLYNTVEMVQNFRLSNVVSSITDNFVKYFVPIVFSVAILSLVFWSLVGDFSRGMVSFVSILVVACPCALGIAIPSVVAIAFGIFSKSGVLVRNFNNLGLVKRVDVFAFDKTGTLTVGKPFVSEATFDTNYISELYSLVSLSNHPLSLAIKEYIEFSFKDIGYVLKKVDNFKVIPGLGIEGEIGGKFYKLERSSNESITSSDFWIFDGGWNKIGSFCFNDKIRQEARDVVKYLSQLGKVILVTGDKCTVAKRISEDLGISEYYCSLLPNQKVDVISKYKDKGSVVMFIGDGINDGPVLEFSDVGVVVSEVDNLVSNVGDVVIFSKNLSVLKFLILFSRKVYCKMLQNLVWAFLYNIIALPIAFCGILTPSIAEVAMSLSSISVLLNSLTLYLSSSKVKFSLIN